MDFFSQKNDQYYCEDVALREIGRQVGTPCYVYSKKTLLRHISELQKAFAGYPTTLCYAVKACSNLSILSVMFDKGLGADLVSLGELERSLKANVDPRKVVFSGVGKQPHEIERALGAGILAFNMESRFELDSVHKVAQRMGKIAPVSLRVNPNIKADTNPKIATGMYTSKFGIPEDEALAMAQEIAAMRHVELVGVACHIGSQMTDLKPLQEAASRVASFAEGLKTKGHKLRFIDMGGGLGIRYQQESPPSLAEYASVLVQEVKKTGLDLIIEPGRVLMGNVGVLLSSVIGVKRTPEKNFLVVDAAMNDLIRPSMYDSYHQIESVDGGHVENEVFDVVGPICETGDFLGKDRRLPRMGEGDFIIVKGAGAYGAVMASNYNSRQRPAEVLVDGDQWGVIRRRESREDLWLLEEPIYEPI